MRLLHSLRWSIAALGAVGLVASLMVLGQGLWAQQQMGHDAKEAFVAKDVVADILPPPMYLIEMRLVLSQAVEGTLDAAEARKQVDRLASEYQARVDYWTQNAPHGLEKQLLGRQHEAAKTFIAAAQAQVMAKLQAGEAEAAKQALVEAHKLYLAHRAGVDETVVAGNAFAASSMASFGATQKQSTTMTLAVAGVAMALVALLARLVLRSIEAPVERCTRMARKIASGDLTQCDNNPTRRKDALGEMEAVLCDMQHQLAQTVGAVRRNAEGVASASAQIASGNLDLSQRTESQAGALQQTASTMSKLGEAVRTNAEHAQQANSLAMTASSVAERGGAVVGQAVETMKGINDSSRKISDIISVIDGIAFQTNILALNAAVEAARAGEQGRGFAVVAAEVRSLAGRSADAAKEIKQLITASVERVESGTTLVDQAGATMNEVVAAIKRVTDIMSDISQASAEQRTGVEEIGDAVRHMDQSTQQNAAMVEEVAAAAGSLKTQADQLVQAVSVFRLTPTDSARSPAFKAASPAPAVQAAKPAPATLRAPAAASPKPAPAAPAPAAADPASTPAPKAAAMAESDDWETF
ncbi:MAG: methyl-accepting chemotaxis protein [Ideonella sp. MAG2]|nr:MAG: methyl-accepting chemotaxis protein [Ideonella sp. MAG2]